MTITDKELLECLSGYKPRPFEANELIEAITRYSEGKAIDPEVMEKKWIAGNRAAWVSVLRLALKEIGYDDEEAQSNRWVVEREETIAVLRRICGGFGDNNWTEDLFLADIIEKHLANHLE